VGLQIPGELADLLNELGYMWPKSDEQKMFELGQDWLTFSGTLQGVNQDAHASAQRVLSDNQSSAIQAFQQKWGAGDSASAVLDRGTAGAGAIGGALMVCSAVVLALKINVIVQLTALAIEIIQAIATAPETFGVSLAEIPLFKKLTDMMVNLAINQAMQAILG
jgi:hypothetical protein